MKRSEVDKIRFTNHFIHRFVERFGSKWGFTRQTTTINRGEVCRRLFRILSEAQDVLPSDPFYSEYCKERYGETRMVKGCGIVFFIRENEITTCMEVNKSFQKPKEPKTMKTFESGAFSLGDVLTNKRVFDKVLV